ncbi:hypothetical protein Ct9H90mP29_20380 [bacterium]|nr:MAG: hypothetical protein Ct9H90mP29_20380 [bacterium]
MESQRAIKIKGGTMRLGAYDCESNQVLKHMLHIEKRKYLNDIVIDMK